MYWRTVGPECNITGAIVTRGNVGIDTHTGRTQCEMKAGTGAMPSPSQGSQRWPENHQKLRHRTDPHGPWKEPSTAGTVILDFQAPKL